MKTAISLVVFAVWLASATPSPAQTSCVVIELFTSEGCSSCPPADALLSQLGLKARSTNPNLIVLGEHVDYWNHDGWTDRFSSAEYSERQSDYARQFQLASPYTPQMVIDGRLQVSGNDRDGVARGIRVAAAAPKPAHVQLAWQTDHHLQVSVQLPERTSAYVLLAITEDNLSSSVRGGENGGRTLHHDAVVRQLQVLGKTKGESFEKNVLFVPPHEWNSANLKAAVLVQQSDGKILGAASIPYKD